MVALAGGCFQIAVVMSARPLWLDEEMIALNVRDRAFTGLSGRLWLDQAAPLGWLMLQRVVLLTLGSGEAALRLVPAGFGIGTLLVAAWAGRRWMGRLPAGVFVLLCAVGSWLAYYPSELKHYSADAFWALLLPTLAVWAVEGEEPRDQLRRARIWWALAAVAHWFSNGGLLAVPAAAAPLAIALSRRMQWRAVREMAAGGLVLLASLALHFVLSVRYTLGSEYLRDYWSGGFPPDSAGLRGSLAWLGSQLRPLALVPGGTEVWTLFWSVSILGCVIARRHLRIVLAGLPLCAFALGALGIVPLLDRAALWVVPALYFGIASFADRALRLLQHAWRQRSAVSAIAAATMVLVLIPLSADIIIRRGRITLDDRQVAQVNHGLNDRAAVEWLMMQRQPGDAIVTTHLALPAMWWYSGTDISKGHQPGSHLDDGSPIFEATLIPASECSPPARQKILAGQRRALIYVGFRDAPEAFGDLLVSEFARTGTTKADRSFGLSRVAVIDWTDASPPESPTPETIERQTQLPGPDTRGCVGLQLARRW